MGVGGATGRLIELGQRQGRAQFEAARRLLLGDGDGGQKSVFRGRGGWRIAFEQNFAADPMQFRFERAKSGALGRCQRLVESSDGALEIACPGFALGDRDLEEPVE